MVELRFRPRHGTAGLFLSREQRVRNIVYVDTALLVLGLAGLWLSARKTVDNAERLIKALGIPSFLFGAVFISVSTGLPEIATAVISTLEGVPELSAGDVVGSSLVNLTFVLGATTLFAKGLELHGEDLDLIRDAGIGTMLAASVLLVVGELSIVAVGALFAIYVGFLYKAEHSSFEMGEDGEASAKTVALTLAGVAGLLVSARFMVGGAKGIGESLGIPLEILGSTVVAVGTGLPELAFEVAAVREGDTSLALGDIFGSTLVNITLTLGILGAIATPSIASLVPVVVGVILVGALALAFSYRGDFSMVEASVLMAVFVSYLVWQSEVLPLPF